MTIVEMMFDKNTLKKFSKHTIFIGVLMLLVGIIGIFLPSFLSLVIVSFLAWLFIFSAIFQGFITWKVYRRSVSAWLKVMLSFIVGVLFILNPNAGVATVAILLSLYLLIDAFSSFSFSMEYKPNSGWWVYILNGILSIILATVLIVGWPQTSFVLVGLFVAISLFFDGVALITLGVGAKKLSD